MEHEIYFVPHALVALRKRGGTEEEARQAINEATWSAAKYGRQEASKTFSYNALWNGKQYQWKQVVPVFVEEQDKIVVITVYVFYF